MIFRMELTYSEIEIILNTKYNAASSIGFTLQPRNIKNSDFTLKLKSLLPDDVKKHHS